MAPDRRTERWTDGKTADGQRQNNIPLPMAGDNNQPDLEVRQLLETQANIIRTNVLTKFHEELTINVTFRVLTRINSPLPGGYVFQQKGTIFELIQDIIRTNPHIKKCPAPWRPCFSTNLNHFKLIQYIIRTNVLTKVLTSFYNSHNWTKFPHIVGTNLLTQKNTPPPGSHFHEDQTIHVASRHPDPFSNSSIDIIGTNLLTKFHDDWTIYMASRVLTRQMLTPHNGEKAITKAHHVHIVLR
ncbi:hypothetical protein DPMN_059960 [Dreissena polymorpha]|uniref:Uncharacterized protein n=1 Tax=Dreissena polymorpha TaxID=45954 RepID=A0A9D4C500_DREPO|nr:hypothetical protein DPMN_059960 [Dreissena polymorpha]